MHIFEGRDWFLISTASPLNWARNGQRSGGCCYLLRIQAYEMRGSSSGVLFLTLSVFDQSMLLE